MKFIGGAPPELVLLNASNEVGALEMQVESVVVLEGVLVGMGSTTGMLFCFCIYMFV